MTQHLNILLHLNNGHWQKTSKEKLLNVWTDNFRKELAKKKSFSPLTPKLTIITDCIPTFNLAQHDQIKSKNSVDDLIKKFAGAYGYGTTYHKIKQRGKTPLVDLHCEIYERL